MQKSIDIEKLLSPYPVRVRDAVKKLLKDSRASNLKVSLDESLLRQAAEDFSRATCRDHWADKTQRERGEWLSKFERATDELIGLMSEAPVTPEQWGFPARDIILANIFYRAGYPIPSPQNVAEFYSKIFELEKFADAECWTISDSLNAYRNQVRADFETEQVLKKPRDEKAARAEFIIHFWQNTNLAKGDVAAVASTLFDDESIDDRMVRRFTAGLTR